MSSEDLEADLIIAESTFKVFMLSRDPGFPKRLYMCEVSVSP